MATLVDLASRYRWELMLLVGIPIFEQAWWWLLPHILGNFNLSLDYWSCPPDYSCPPRFISPFLNISLYLLGFFYFHVRRTGRTTLTLLWAFAFVSEAVETATYLLLTVDYLGQWSTIEISGSGWSWQMGLEFLPATMVLVWFARQASKISFGHALVLIGLTNFLFSFGVVISNLENALFADWAESWIWVTFHLLVTLFALWVLSRVDVSREKHQPNIERWTGGWRIPSLFAPLTRLAVQVLPRFDPASGISKELIIALIGLYLLPLVYFHLRSWVVYGFDSPIPIVLEMVTILYTPLLTVIVILLAYAVRVDEPTEDLETAEPKTSPPKPFLCPSYSSPEEPPTS